ncbi:hypothetical protein Bca52824_032886 [Brassica carinata]|uniref:Uncharacterized protein n=1 Tax=Brassica carinata TaxID=52824 RepID=A0A8X7SCW0_BRACI|nr:hypothetical protein Bca52824_032886 [Brassica carinata]
MTMAGSGTDPDETGPRADQDELDEAGSGADEDELGEIEPGADDVELNKSEVELVDSYGAGRPDDWILSSNRDWVLKGNPEKDKLLDCLQRFGKMFKKLKGETPTLHGEIGSDERWSHETSVVGDVQPNDEDGDNDEGSSSQTLKNCGNTRVGNSMSISLFVKDICIIMVTDFNPPLNRLDVSLNDLEYFANAMEEWTEQMGALDMRVAALEQDAVMNKMDALDMRVTALEENPDVNKMEQLDMRVSPLEAYLEKVCEDTDEDVKREENKGKGVKRSVHTLDNNLSRTVTKSKKKKEIFVSGL